MARTSLADVACSIARSADVVGDAWNLLILRDVFTGVVRFDDLARDLGMSRKVLTARLNLLVDEGVLVRVPYSRRPLRHEYRATRKGEELYPVLIALMAWGDRWYGDDRGAPVRVRHLPCGADVVPETICPGCRTPLVPADTEHLPGPGGQAGHGTWVVAERLLERAARQPPSAPGPDRAPAGSDPSPDPAAAARIRRR